MQVVEKVRNLAVEVVAADFLLQPFLVTKLGLT